MNRREKALLGMIGLLSVLFAGGWFARNVLLRPLNNLEQQKQEAQEALRKLKETRSAYLRAESYLQQAAARSFGTNTDLATAQAGHMLTEQLSRLGLPEANFNFQPVPARKIRGGQETGWSVQGEGPLGKMIDLLFVLEQTPQLHKIENLVISPGDRPGRIRARFHYLTLVININSPGPQPELKPTFALNSPQRRLYDVIVQRDLLRPYVPGTPDRPRPVTPSVDPASRPETLKIVSLSQWRGDSEVHVCDLTNMKVTSYKTGETLAGGEILGVDYRTMPLAGSAGLVSDSRVILKSGTNYWAVEQGQTLATRYQLAPEQLPAELCPK